MSETTTTPEKRTDEAPCPAGCGATVEFEQVAAFGNWFPPRPPICDECQATKERAELQRQELERSRRHQAVADSRRKNLLELLEKTGASPWEHGRASFETFDTSECGPEPLQAARTFVAQIRRAQKYDPVPGLYLAGPTGTGKSHLGTAIVRELILDPEIDPGTIVFDPADVLISRIRSLYGGRGDVDAFLRRRERARVWVLDDLGREPPHPDVVGHLTMLISQRSRRGTVITGNLEPEEYEQRSPDLARIGSRLGPAYFRAVRLEGRDRRFDAA